MAINGVNVGRDVSLSVQTAIGTLSIDITTAFDPKPEYDKRKSRPLNGTPLNVPIPAGWNLTIELDRANADVESFFAAQEAGYFAGNGIAPATINETIQNADGSISVFLYQDLMLTLDDAGRKTADDIIKMRIAGEAGTRIQLQ